MQELADQKALEFCAQQCGVMGDTNKLKICYLLRYHPELSVSDIAELAGMTISNTSHALSRLKAVRLVKSRKSARSVYYSLEDNAFGGVLKMMGADHA